MKLLEIIFLNMMIFEYMKKMLYLIIFLYIFTKKNKNN